MRTARAARWLVLPWLALVYTWGTSEGSVPMGAVHLPGVLPPAVVGQTLPLFTALMLLHAALYAVSLVVTLGGRGRVVYAAAQGLLVLLMGLLPSNWSLAMALYLALEIDSIMLLERPRPVVIAASSYLALFVLTYLARISPVFGTAGRAPSESAGVALFVAGVAAFVVLYSQRAHAYERSQALVSDLESAQAQLAASAARIEDLTLQAERQRIARELHDTVTQGLAGLIMQLEAADARLAARDPARAREIVQHAMVRARSAFTAARYAIEGLREEATGHTNMLSAVQDEIARFSAETAIVCESELDGLAHLPPSLHDPILRVIGEGLVNITRHAHAHHAWVRVVRDARTVEVEVRDDGVGFDLAAGDARGHYGLRGLRERTRLAGGSLDVRRGPDGGVALRLSLPYAAPAETAARADGRGGTSGDYGGGEE